MARKIRSIVIDEEFEVTSLRDLERQVIKAARDAYRARLSQERWDRKHPNRPGSSSYYDLNEPGVAEMWADELVKQIQGDVR